MPTVLKIGSETLDPDITITETYSYTAVTTSYPVQQGANLVDHVQEQPQSIALSCMISEDPVTLPSFGSGGATFANDGNAQRLQGSLKQRASLFIDRLRATWQAGETITLQSALRGTIRNLVATNISEPRNLAGAVTIGLTLVQIRTVASRFVEIPPTLTQRAKKKRAKGKQPTKTVGSAPQRQSLLLKLSNAF